MILATAKRRLAALACGVTAAMAAAWPAAATNITLEFRNALPAPVTIQTVGGGQCVTRGVPATTVPAGGGAALTISTPDLARCAAGLAAASQSFQTVIDGRPYSGTFTVAVQAPAYQHGLPTPMKQVNITTSSPGAISLGVPPVFYVGLVDDVDVSLVATCLQSLCPRAVASLTMANDTGKDATISLQPECAVSEQGDLIPLPKGGYVALNLYATKTSTCFGSVGAVAMTVSGMTAKVQFASDPAQSSVQMLQTSTDGHDLPNRYGPGQGAGLTLFNFWLTCTTRECMMQK